MTFNQNKNNYYFKYELYDEDGCIRKFKSRDEALNFKRLRPELKIKVIKKDVIKINFDNLGECLF